MSTMTWVNSGEIFITFKRITLISQPNQTAKADPLSISRIPAVKFVDKRPIFSLQLSDQGINPPLNHSILARQNRVIRFVHPVFSRLSAVLPPEGFRSIRWFLSKSRLLHLPPDQLARSTSKCHSSRTRSDGYN